jgi:hypothetical protein
MKITRPLFALVAACGMAAAAFAAEANPTGTWKWATGRTGEQTLNLVYQNGQLSGTLLGEHGGRFQFPDTPISEASCQGGVIKFSVTRELGGTKVTTRYEGKLEGDSIKGSSERPNIQGKGERLKRDWQAHRVAS